jgi:peptide/nickel transport system substrate-binding protein
MSTEASKRITRRHFLSLATLAAASASLAACAPQATPAAAPTAGAPAATNAPQAAATSAPAAPAATAAPAAAATSAPAAGKKILRVAYTREIDVLNAFTSQMLCDIEFTMQEGLIQNDDKGQDVPVLAKEIPTLANGGIVDNKDGTYDITWKLQPNVKWHDGQPFTSKDVAFTWKFVSDPASQTYNSDEYRGIKSVKTPDDTTVVFTWDGLYGLYSNLFESMLPEHVLGTLTVDQIVQNDAYNRSGMGTGPFKFAEWKSGEYIRVVKNTDYWRGDQYPNIDEIVFSFIPDDNTRLNALKAGDYNIGEILPVQVKDMQDDANGKVILINSNSYLHFDTSIETDKGKALFSDVKVRQAMYHAIDRQAIATQLMEGTVTVIDAPYNPSSVWYNKAVTSYNYDVATAKQMLDDAGWVPGADGIRVKDGQKFSFVMLNRSGKQDRIAVAQVIQAQLKEVGIDVQFETLEATAYTAKWRTGKWEGTVSGWFLSADPSITAIYGTGGSNNMTGYGDAKLDAVLNDSDKFLDFDKRKPLIDQAQVILADDAFTLPLYAQVTPMYVSNNLVNFKGSGTNLGSFWNVYEWDLS